MNQNRLLALVKDAVYCFISTEAEVLSLESTPIHTGSQAVELTRNKVRLHTNTGISGNPSEGTTVSLITKQATFIERSALSRLYSQAMNVPFSLSSQPLNESRSLLCIQDVDCQTDYSKLDIERLQEKELQALACIHYVNMGCINDLPWLPKVDEAYIAGMINDYWSVSWEYAKGNPAFAGTFGVDVISAIEAAAGSIVHEMAPVIQDASTYTMIHNDLNPGNVLVHNNEDVYFIDWEEARYGSLFMDIPMRCGSLQQAQAYRACLGNIGLDIPEPHFAKLFTVASRYQGLRFMCWNLGVWEHNEQAKTDLIKYMKMVTQPLFSS